MRRKKRVAVFDFDGTFTDLSEEVKPFRATYLDEVAARVGGERAAFDTLVGEAEARVVAHPEQFGWLYEGQIVAAASADPYVELRAVCELVLTETCAIADQRERSVFLEGLFHTHSANVRSVFKPNVLPLLTALERKDLYACVVTNSRTEPVQKKLQLLGGDESPLGWLIDRVFGNARKYVVDPTFEILPRALHLSRSGLPVLLRRRAYYELIDRLRREQVCQWSDVLVMGDIFALDLATPFAAGATVVLVDHERISPHERAFVQANHPRTHLVQHPAEVLPLLG